MSASAYPLTWPANRPFTVSRQDAKFRDGARGRIRVSLDLARVRLEEQLDRLKASNVILSMNIKLTLLGRRDMNVSRAEPSNPGAAVYFDLYGKPHVLACDRWNTVADNIAAVAAHIDALRAQQRWGVADLRQAFAGHIALPAPDWRKALGFTPNAQPTRTEVDEAYRQRAKVAHPNAGGDRSSWDELSAAYDSAKRERP